MCPLALLFRSHEIKTPSLLLLLLLLHALQKKQVQKPYFTDPSADYVTSATLHIGCDTEGATIYYTVDGDDPGKGKAGSRAYDSKGKVVVSGIGVHTVRAIGTKEGMEDSDVISKDFTVEVCCFPSVLIWFLFFFFRFIFFFLLRSVLFFFLRVFRFFFSLVYFSLNHSGSFLYWILICTVLFSLGDSVICSVCLTFFPPMSRCVHSAGSLRHKVVSLQLSKHQRCTDAHRSNSSWFSFNIFIPLSHFIVVRSRVLLNKLQQ